MPRAVKDEEYYEDVGQNQYVDCKPDQVVTHSLLSSVLRVKPGKLLALFLDQCTEFTQAPILILSNLHAELS